MFLQINNMLSYHRETALQDALVLVRLELGDNMLRTL